VYHPSTTSGFDPDPTTDLLFFGDPRLQKMQTTACIQSVSALGSREVGFIEKHGQYSKLV
jgi:hypothetical protein